MKRLFKKSRPNPLGDIPLSPGGMVVFDDPGLDNPWESLASMLSASLVYNQQGESPDATFLLGVSTSETSTMFPLAQDIQVRDVLDGLVLSPGVYALMLRLLYGEGRLERHHHDLLLLEMLGLHAPAPIPLPLLPEWIEDQLNPKNIIRCLTHPLVDERIAGAAFKSLMMHPLFSFSMLDHLPGVAQRVTHGEDVRTEIDVTTMKKPVKDAFRQWTAHSREVVKVVSELVRNPPPELFFLAEMQRCIDIGGVWRLPDELATQVAKGLHVFGMANGLRQRNHWLINTASPAFQSDLPEIKRSLERFGYQLWQETEARKSGFGPSLWVYWTGELTGTGARRMLHATQAALGSLKGLSPLLQEDRESRGEDLSPIEHDEFNAEAPGLYEAASGQFRHMHEHERKALDAIVSSMVPSPA